MRYSILLQQKTQRGDCKRYSLSIEDTENEKPYTRRELEGKTAIFKNNSDIKICFPINFNNCTLPYCK